MYQLTYLSPNKFKGYKHKLTRFCAHWRHIFTWKVIFDFGDRSWSLFATSDCVCDCEFGFRTQANFLWKKNTRYESLILIPKATHFYLLDYVTRTRILKRGDRNKNKNWTWAQNILNYHNFRSITSCDEKHNNLKLYLSLKDQIMSTYFSLNRF